MLRLHKALDSPRLMLGISPINISAGVGLGRNFSHYAFLALAAFSLALGATPVRADNFETRLAPAPLTDGTRNDVMGEGHATAELNGNRLTVKGDFQGLTSNATTAHLYDGIRIGAMGPKAFDITVTPRTAGSVSGSVTLSAAQVRAVRAGHFYILINSQKAPEGNLIGWLLPPHPFAGEAVPVAGHGFLPQLDVPRK